MLFPTHDTLLVEVFLAGITVFKCLLILVHLGETNHTVLVVLKVNLFAGFFSIHVLESRLQSFLKLIVQDFVGIFGDGCTVPEIVKDLVVLSQLSHNEINVFAGFFFHFKVHA